MSGRTPSDRRFGHQSARENLGVVPEDLFRIVGAVVLSPERHGIAIPESAHQVGVVDENRQRARADSITHGCGPHPDAFKDVSMRYQRINQASVTVL